MSALLLLVLAGNPLTAANGHVDTGNKLFSQGKLEEALGEYDKAARALPNEPGVRFNRGAALFGLGKYDEAQKEFLRATEAKDPQLKESAFYNMGNSFFKLERYKEAVDAYKRALGTDPRDVRAKWNLELALRKLREQEQKQKQQQQQNKDQNKDQDQNQKQNQDQQQQQAQNPQQQKQQRPEGVPEPKDKKDEGKQQQVEAPKDKPVDKQDAEAVLDALERGEKNLELEQARMRARGRRKPVKDW